MLGHHEIFAQITFNREVHPKYPKGEPPGRPGNDLTYRLPLIVEALAKLRSQSCIIDGEAVSCGDDGIASFDRIRFGSVGDAPRSTCMRNFRRT